MSTEAGIGLIGYGGIGRVHALCYRMLPLTHPELSLRPRLVAVAVTSARSAERARHELGDVATTTDVEELLHNPEVTLVDCCAPTGEHAAIAAATLRAGKALLCEKPLTASAAESAALVALARERGLVGAVHYHFRGIPALQEARRRIEAGLLGEVLGFSMRYFRSSNLRRDRPATWRSSGPGSGTLVDLGAHLVDLAHVLFGPIISVSARTRTVIATRPDARGGQVRIEADDDAWLSVELDGGVPGTIVVSKVVPGASDDIRIEAYGTEGALLFDTRDPNTLIVAGANGPPGGQTVTTLSRATPPPTVPGAETPTATTQWHLTAIAAFLDALGRGEPPPVDLEAALAVDRVIDAALQSAGEGGRRKPIV